MGLNRQNFLLKKNNLSSGKSMIFNFIMTQNPQQFFIPQLNIYASQAELKEKRKKMLVDHYAQQIKYAPSKNKQILSSQSLNPIDFRELNQAQIQYQKAKRAEIAQNYREEAERKANRKRQQRERKIQQEKMMLENLEKVKAQEKRKLQQLNLAYRRDRLDDLQQKQKEKTLLRQKLKEEKEKDFYIAERKGMANVSRKKLSYDQYYEKFNGLRQQIEKNYLEKWSPQIKRHQLQKDRIVYKGIEQNDERIKNSKLAEHLENQKRKDSLKEELMEQIRKKQVLKEESRTRQKSQSYISESYHSRHHPINNPVDFKITHDNRYIMNELKSEEGMSGLARSGSHALLC